MWHFSLLLSMSCAAITQPAQFKTPAPEFFNVTEWVNSKPLKLSELRGKVVVVHFFAFSCINCIHNYPWYKEVQEKYKDSEVVLIGIHTPETENEYNIERLRKKLEEAGLTHPVAVDNDKANWNRYGNRIWPCVYLIDKKGNGRFRWDGELKWQGAKGDVVMHEKIHLLLKEK
ncbi:MAG TPA: redoxin domain-containing protein [Gemmatales bacterium]|nr:redoxin domain-containing protein [Gemmatales bacterium]